MKAIRIICIIIAWLWIIVSAAGSIITIRKSPHEELAFHIGSILGGLILAIPSFILLFIARRIKRRMEKKEKQALIDSFETI
jgi:uncharacterized membrane protein YbhN (UPF0104 family)